MWRGITLRCLGRLDGGIFQGGLGRKPGGNWDRGPGCPGGQTPVDEMGKIVSGIGADYVKKQEYVGVDDEKLLELGVLRQKENNGDVCL